MHRIREVLDPRDNFILIGQDVVEDGWAVFADRRRPCGHCQCDAGLGSFRVISGIAFLGHTVLRIRRLVACRHDPISKLKVFKLVGLQQWISRHSVFPWMCAVEGDVPCFGAIDIPVKLFRIS